MGAGGRFIVWLLFLQLTQDALAASEVRVTPKNAVVNPGDEISISCKVNSALENCQFRFADASEISLKKGRLTQGVEYFGQGLEAGECGAFIKRVEKKHHGDISCSLTRESDGIGRVGTMHLIVAIPPEPPTLRVSVGTGSGTETGPRVYKEKDQLIATCTVKNGRPAANISWFLGDEPVTEGLPMAVETCMQQDNGLCTIQQNLTRILQAADHKKQLKCVSSHHSFKDRPQETTFEISVTYPPRKKSEPIHFFNLVEGALGEAKVTVEANPQPQITWAIGGDHIYENSNNGRFSVKRTEPKGPGQYETVLLIDDLTKEDTMKEYKVTAHNDLGETEYTIILSTSEEPPKVLEMGADIIIIIIVTIGLLIVVIGGVFYARAKGKLCFAARDAEKRVTSPSEGTENPAVNHHASTEYISNSDLKKEKPKEDTPV
uniref:Ig-like domain-containing protein n=1 Tax=Cuerna arida TaxID=1464854 RepID=A0A1B6GGZ2_9HEMI